MFTKRRSEIQIIAEILDLSQEGAKKTELLYKNNMNFTQLQNYLTFLIKNDIMKEEVIPNTNGGASKLYTTTEKGDNLLEDINKILTYFK